MTPEQSKLKRLRTEFDYYSRSLLRVREKSGKIVPFSLNAAQVYLHQRIEEQRERTGRVRALVLKGRQQGISTYLQGRYFWKVSGERGKRAFILTHEQKATDNLFGMAQRFLDNLAPPWRPSVGASNAKELRFDVLDSGYMVATAGSADTGRSATAQYFHGSEAAYWDRAESHMAGIGQIIPDLPGTEIVIESTANGVGNLFHKLWQLAESGASDYIAVFIPWFWSTEYRRTVGSEWKRTPEEQVYAEAYKLDDEQLAWRRSKIAGDFGGDEARFRGEYPATASEAFVAVGHEPFIAPSLVLQAQAATTIEGGPLTIGVDPARFGDDNTAIVSRRGRVVRPNIERHRKLDTMQVAGRVANLIRTLDPDAVFIDVGGLGAGVYDRLIELGFGRVVFAVNFGSSPIHGDRYVNKRAEMWGDMRDWLKAQPAQIPADDGLLGDLTGPKFSYDSNGRVKLESKDDMRKRGFKSPDAGDALALTFAMPVASRRQAQNWEEMLEEHEAAGGADEDRTGFQTG